MSAPPERYQRLPGSGRRLQGVVSVSAARCSLWLGSDHLLSIDRVWMNEGYKRFYFRDIQALTLQRTVRSTIANGILVAVLAIVGTSIWIIVLNVGDSDLRIGWSVFLGIMGALFFLLLVVSLARGASCLCRVQTAVQSEVLPSLGRLHTARKVIARLTPIIAAAQAGQGAPAPPAPPPLPPPPISP